jgi:hypothetical protein
MVARAFGRALSFCPSVDRRLEVPLAVHRFLILTLQDDEIPNPAEGWDDRDDGP